MAALLKEEENYVRLALLLKGVSPRAVRLYFDRELPPTDLHSTLNTNKKNSFRLEMSESFEPGSVESFVSNKCVVESNTFNVTGELDSNTFNVTGEMPPDSASFNITCVPDSNIFDVEGLPDSNTCDARGFPDSASFDITCVPDSNTFDVESVPNSTTFDVTLMICLIRNLTSVSQPINGFNSLPPSVETTPEADLARIKWYRNILSHHDSNKMATVDFDAAWSNIADAVSRLGGQPMKQECQELKVKILDQSNREIMLEIKQLQKEMEELRLALNNPIPLNIRGQIKEELEIWAEDDKMFIETNGAKSTTGLQR
ncbi:unnamed protein product [Mytilus edulis]|uniref:DZIP3-like HEPN domain-containing protein n=1 Tax=Mytilus edulis TaxID=6550 RepID=A0A8S3T780_MYTED|nr:unnamed protein product [Mytilus edulis]